MNTRAAAVVLVLSIIVITLLAYQIVWSPFVTTTTTSSTIVTHAESTYPAPYDSASDIRYQVQDCYDGYIQNGSTCYNESYLKEFNYTTTHTGAWQAVITQIQYSGASNQTKITFDRAVPESCFPNLQQVTWQRTSEGIVYSPPPNNSIDVNGTSTYQQLKINDSVSVYYTVTDFYTGYSVPSGAMIYHEGNGCNAVATDVARLN